MCGCRTNPKIYKNIVEILLVDFELDSSSLAVATIAQAIEDVGFDAAPKTDSCGCSSTFAVNASYVQMVEGFRGERFDDIASSCTRSRFQAARTLLPSKHKATPLAKRVGGGISRSRFDADIAVLDHFTEAVGSEEDAYLCRSPRARSS